MTTRLTDQEVAELRAAAKAKHLYIYFDHIARANGQPFVLVRTGKNAQSSTLAACVSFNAAMQWLGVKK